MTALLRLLGTWLYAMRLHRAVIWLNRRNVRVLAYHACDRAESPFIAGLGINTPPDTFASHLAFLATHYTVVSLADLESTSTAPDRSVVITFDDGFRSVYTGALPLLRAARMPATVYLVATAVDNARLIWVNELNWLLHERSQAAAMVARELGAPTSDPRTLMSLALMSPPAAISALLDRLAAGCGIDRDNLAREARLHLSAAELAEMAGAGVTFGNHTATHVNLAECAPEVVRAEVDGGRRPTLPGWCWSFAYPFGRYSETARRVVRERGHRTVMRIGGVNRRLELTDIARTPVGSESVAELFAEMEVVQPVKDVLRRVLRRAPYGYRNVV